MKNENVAVAGCGHRYSMGFGGMLAMLRDGKCAARSGWNGKGMHLQLVKPPQSAAPHEPMYQVDGVNDRLLPWIGMRTADGGFVPWLASQTDMLAEDWVVVE
ncbi:DUF2829 domain-containing protein [Kluyvera sp. CHPC 1.2972]|uniref:DUF2829 domain-containing protein n=1 Tax=Kluyvera sp. CHPC 1.2972 TaxID=2995176 RepID=UPI002FD7BA08